MTDTLGSPLHPNSFGGGGVQRPLRDGGGDGSRAWVGEPSRVLPPPWTDFEHMTAGYLEGDRTRKAPTAHARRAERQSGGLD